MNVARDGADARLQDTLGPAETKRSSESWPRGLARDVGAVRRALFAFCAAAAFLGGFVPPSQAVAQADAEVVQISAEIRRGDKGPYLAVRAEIASGYHVYSITQPPPPLKTLIKIAANNQFKVGDFTATPAPTVVEKDNQKTEEHAVLVEWTAPIELGAGVDASDLAIEGSVRYQACTKESCLFPKTVKFTAKPVQPKERTKALPMSGPPSLPGSGKAPAAGPKLDLGVDLGEPAVGDVLPLRAGEAKANAEAAPPAVPAAAPADGGYQAFGSHTRIVGRVVPAVAKPGETAYVELTFTPSAAEEYHLYGLAEKSEGKDGYRPLLAFLDQAGGTTPLPGRISQAAKDVYSKGGGKSTPQYHGAVTLWFPVQIPATAAGPIVLSGAVGYQSCTEGVEKLNIKGSCDQPKGVRFIASVTVSAQPDAVAAASSGSVSFKSLSYSEVDKLAQQEGVINLARGVQVGAPEGVAPAPAATAVATPATETKKLAALAAKESGVYQAMGSHTRIVGRVLPAVVKPGGTVHVELTLVPSAAEDFHLYGLAEKNDNKPGYLPLLVVLDQAGGAAPQPGRVNQAPKQIFSKTADQTTPQYHGAATVWIPVQIPAGATGPLVLSGAVGYQSCNSANCDRPLGARFTATVEVSPQPDAAAAATSGALAFKSTSYSEVNKLAQQEGVFNLARGVEVGPPAGIAPVAEIATPTAHPSNVVRGSDAPKASATVKEASSPVAAAAPGTAALAAARAAYTPSDLLFNVLIAFLGGGLMNFMPCVLPVIGLKVLAFAQQAKESRLRSLMLNIFYSLGILAVFWILAGFAAFTGLAWGQQFTKPAFVMSLVAVVWVMALSFLGVWEIPIPGFAMSDSAQALAAKEGFSGAFLKGIITTLLATPCGAPFMASAIAFTAGKPPVVVFSVFTAVGLGMSAPYLVLGLFPALGRFMPKPGAWMNTFKEFLGFVLLFTVVFLCASLSQENMIVMFTIMIGLWMSCWILGRAEEDASLLSRARTWTLAAAPTAAVLAFCFVTGPKLEWQPYSETKLAELRREGKTVLVDFTADWCLNCKTVERIALNRSATKQAVSELGVVPLEADWTTESEEIAAALARHDSQSIPLTVIYPGNGGEPIVLRDIYTQTQLLEALKKAGPSKEAPAGPAVARND